MVEMLYISIRNEMESLVEEKAGSVLVKRLDLSMRNLKRLSVHTSFAVT